MNINVAKVIDKCKNENKGEIFLSLKPSIDDLTMTVAQLYSYGGKMCYFDVPTGNGFNIWDKEYKNYSYGELEFAEGRGFKYLFANWDNMIKTCYNRAQDEDNFKKGKVSGKKPVNRYEQMRKNMVAAYNPILSEELLTVIDMEYSIDKEMLGNIKSDKNLKADLVCAAVEDNRIIFYLTEYRSTKNSFGVSLQKDYDDMSMYYSDNKIKEHLIKILQERVAYGLIECNDDLKNTIDNLTADNTGVRLLFLFSNADDIDDDNRNALAKGYEYIAQKALTDGPSVKYGYIECIDKGCLKKTILRDFKGD